MALIRKKEIQKMDKKSRAEKIKELRYELIRANVTANRTNAKTREIKRAIARLMTLDNSREEVKNK